MTARILGFHEGLKVLEHVDLIRIVSSTYNLLILKDYAGPWRDQRKC